MMNDILNALRSNSDFAILTHINPDGDALGSSFAIKRSLEVSGKSADLYIAADKLPQRYSFLSEGAPHRTEWKADRRYECVICLDCAARYRLGSFQDMLNNAGIVLNIDHHETNDGFGDVNLILDRASTGEIVFDLLKALGWTIEPYTANALYAAISTDTGRFAYESVSKDTFLAAADLCDCGLDIPFVSNEVFFSRTMDATHMYGVVIKNMSVVLDGSVAVSHITSEDIKGLMITGSDYENAIDVIREIYGINVAVFIRELRPKRFKVSFRSKADVDVAAVASVFGGGGHKRAAGCSVDGELYDVRDRVIDVLKGFIV